MEFAGASRIDLDLPVHHEHSFNPSIAEWRGTRYLAYRIRRDPRSQIVVCRLGSDWSLVDERVWPVLHPEGTHAPTSCEDPRLFVHAGRLLVSFTVANSFPRFRPRPAIAEIDESLRPVWCRAVSYDRMSVPEKNWTFFSSGGRIWCIYGLRPHRVLSVEMDKNGITCRDLAEEPGITDWPLGAPRGGSTLVRANGELLGLFHSCVYRGLQHTYYAAPYTIAASPPFPLLRYARVPLVSGLTHERFPRCIRKAVVFPAGLMLEGDDLLVSIGWNDREVRLYRNPLARVVETLRPAQEDRVGSHAHA